VTDLMIGSHRVSNGDQVSRVAALAMKRGKSVDFTGYRQRHVTECGYLIDRTSSLRSRTKKRAYCSVACSSARWRSAPGL